MLKPESVLKNETHKIHWDFEIQTNYLIPIRRLDVVLNNKKNLPYSEFCRPSGQQSENQRKRKERQERKLENSESSGA